MAVTRTRVFLHNESDQPLALLSKEESDGEWTTAPPDHVAPRTVAVFGTESADFDPDNEGRATYQIGDSPSSTLYLHWSDALVGGNAFHTHTDDRHYAFWTASPGNHPDVHFVLRHAGTVTTDFLPSRDGFWFGNSFGDVPYSLPPLRGSALDNKYGNAKSGLCGGMVFGALDYFNAGWRIPADTTAPMGEQFPLFTYLVDRLFATFSLETVSLMLALINPAYPDGDENMMTDLGLASGRAAVMAHEEWPIIRADLDAGRPSPMFITTVKSLNPFDLGECHQILAYGYDVHGHEVTIHVYDPNTPERAGGTCDQVRLSFNDGDVSQRIVVTHNVDVTDDGHQLPIYCFGRMNYSFREPVVPTQPRMAGREVDRRGVSVLTGDPVTVSSAATSSGEEIYDVGPNCGSHTFAYTEYAEVQKVTISARPHGYYRPVVTWRVGGRTVDPGTDGEITVSATPAMEERTVSVTVHVRLAGDTLTLLNRPEDGNYSLTVDVRSVESGDAADSGRAWATTTSFTGARREVPGLSEAMGRCMREYIVNHRAGAVDIEAEIAALYAQLHRPPDPLWDPDPVMLEANTLVLATQPDLDELSVLSRVPQVVAEVTTDTPPTAAVATGLDPGATAVIPDALKELTGEELKAKVRLDLEKELGAGGFDLH